MKQAVVELLLTLLNSKPTGLQNGRVLGHCPLGPWNHNNGIDKNPSFNITFSEVNKSKAHCWSCNFHGDLMDLAMTIQEKMHKHKDTRYKMSEAMQLIANEYEEPAAGIIPPFNEHKTVPIEDVIYPETWLESFKSWGGFPDAIKYLESRNVPLYLADKMSLRFDPIQRRICFPYRNFNGQLMGVQGRAIDKDAELRYFFYVWGKKRNMHIWLGEQHVDLDKPVVLVEGPFDYASVRRVYDNVLASFTCGLGTNRLKRLRDAAHVISFYDWGKGGEAARDALDKHHKGEMTHLLIQEEGLDPGAMNLEQLTECLAEHVKLKK